MYRIWGGVGILTAALFGLGGCLHTDTQLKKPPKQPEEYRTVPDSDPRYNKPVEYPKETMDRDPLQTKNKNGDKSQNPLDKQGGMGGSMGGGGPRFGGSQ